MAICTIASLVVVDVLATCGGGGGGTGGLVVYWVPASANELQKSSLRNSRTLSLYAAQCVTTGVADAGTSLGQKFLALEAVFASIINDREFLSLTAGADGKLPMPRGRH